MKNLSRNTWGMLLSKLHLWQTVPLLIKTVTYNLLKHIRSSCPPLRTLKLGREKSSMFESCVDVCKFFTFLFWALWIKRSLLAIFSSCLSDTNLIVVVLGLENKTAYHSVQLNVWITKSCSSRPTYFLLFIHTVHTIPIYTG